MKNTTRRPPVVTLKRISSPSSRRASKYISERILRQTSASWRRSSREATHGCQGREGHHCKASHPQADTDDGKGIANHEQAAEDEEEEDTLSTKDVYVLAKDLAVNWAQIRRLTWRRTHRTKVDGGDAVAFVIILG